VVRHGVEYDWQFNYFYSKEVTEEEFSDIERGCLTAKEFGLEVKVQLHEQSFLCRSMCLRPVF
jgi:hypothetical protein